MQESASSQQCLLQKELQGCGEEAEWEGRAGHGLNPKSECMRSALSGKFAWALTTPTVVPAAYNLVPGLLQEISRLQPQPSICPQHGSPRDSSKTHLASLPSAQRRQSHQRASRSCLCPPLGPCQLLHF